MVAADRSSADDLPRPGQTFELGVTARRRLLLSLLPGITAAAAAVAVSRYELAPLVGWAATATAFVVWIWRSIHTMDAEATAARAVAEDPSEGPATAVLLSAAVASLGAVFYVVATAPTAGTVGGTVDITLGILTVVASWSLVHTVFSLRYARLYYAGPDGGVNFNQTAPPCYSDFLYLSFTIGMTFQVSDTALTDSTFRRTALHQALLSYLLGAVIIATTINLVAGLAK